MKMILFALILGASTVATAQNIDIGDLIRVGKKLASSKVNCNASYHYSRGGVFGRENSTEVVNIKAKSTSEACLLAQSRASRGGGVFGPQSRTLQSLQCTNALRQSFFVDIYSCQPIR